MEQEDIGMSHIFVSKVPTRTRKTCFCCRKKETIDLSKAIFELSDFPYQPEWGWRIYPFGSEKGVLVCSRECYQRMTASDIFEQCSEDIRKTIEVYAKARIAPDSDKEKELLKEACTLAHQSAILFHFVSKRNFDSSRKKAKKVSGGAARKSRKKKA